MSELSLVDFLLARLDSDERHARKLLETDARPVLSLAVTVNHPARVLVEVESKRRIVAEHPASDEDERNEWAFVMDADGFEHRYTPCETCGSDSVPEEWPCPTLRLLASVYADHDQYDERWKP